MIFSNIVFSTSKGALVGCPQSGINRRCVIPRNARVVNRGTFRFAGMVEIALPSALGRVESFTFGSYQFLR